MNIMNNIRNGPAINIHSFKTKNKTFSGRCLAVEAPNNNTKF